MEYIPNVCLCLLWLLVDTVAMTGSKNITVNPDLTMIQDDPDPHGGDPCHLSNSTLLNVIITFNSTIQTGGGGGRLLASPRGSGRRLLENQNESNCINRLGVGGGGRLSIRWDWEEQRKTGTQMENNERCRINIQLDLKWSNNGTADVESDGLGLVVMDATLILEMSSLAPLQTPDELVLPSRAKVLSNGDLGVIQKIYKCTNIRQVAAESEEAYSHQVATDADCASNDWRQIQVKLLTENRSEENNSTSGQIPWNNYEMACDLTQTTNAVENDGKMSPLSPHHHQPNNPSTIYVATAFAILVLCIVVVYFVVKNRRQRASSYAAMNDD